MSGACPSLGFTVRAVLHASTTEREADAMVDDLIVRLEANGMMMGGGGDRVHVYGVSREAGQATQADRDLIVEWASQWASVAQVTVSDLIDLDDVQ
ncbi:MAG TPA: 50S ribosome-binding protein YggL [Gemmatimonadaceae bacterium]|jgi:uncharacterized protein YggL (DUF469 family)|nr:50S ribosome-binding protein YggL [Gemmatimonadaceae bacterium]